MIRRALVLLGSLGAARATTTNWGAGVGWCYSSLDREIGKATGQACWDLCAATYDIATTPDADRLVAVDWNEWEECFCQSDCQCMMDVGDMNGYLMTTSNITSLPGNCPSHYYDDDDHPGCNGMVEWPYLLLAVALTAIVATIISFGCVLGGCCNSCPAESVISPIHLLIHALHAGARRRILDHRTRRRRPPRKSRKSTRHRSSGARAYSQSHPPEFAPRFSFCNFMTALIGAIETRPVLMIYFYHNAHTYFSQI